MSKYQLYMPSRQTGAFVYRGAGKKQAVDADPAQKKCQQLACNIQWCLAKNNHKQVRCQDFVKAWEECVAKVNEQDAAKAESG